MITNINYNLASAYDEAGYSMFGGYLVENKEIIWQSARHAELLPQLNILPNETVLIIGAGFGWIAEKWQAQGIGPICAVDTSQWIQSEKAQNANIEIYDFDITDYSTHTSIKQVLGLQPSDKIDWCITEDFFTEITDQSCLDIAAVLRSIGNHVVHYITKKPAEELLTIPEFAIRNYKTEEEWNALLSSDRIIIR